MGLTFGGWFESDVCWPKRRRLVSVKSEPQGMARGASDELRRRRRHGPPAAPVPVARRPPAPAVGVDSSARPERRSVAVDARCRRLREKSGCLRARCSPEAGAEWCRLEVMPIWWPSAAGFAGLGG